MPNDTYRNAKKRSPVYMFREGPQFKAEKLQNDILFRNLKSAQKQNEKQSKYKILKLWINDSMNQ